MPSTDPTYIIYAPEFNENNGGCIFQHELVHALNTRGERALLWPMKLRKSVRHRIHDAVRRPGFRVSPHLVTPVARPQDLDDTAIVVYPEITLGNPLRARNVVRWLLYKPGLLHPYDFGKEELFFCVDEMCDLPELTGGAPALFLWKINRAYRNLHRPDRKGSCFMVRKGRAKPKITETADAIQLDGMTHAEIADVFNRCEYFYSYDEATMYSQYAAVCGCTSIVIPGEFRSRQEWVEAHPIARYGVAYGLDDVDHARATRDKTVDLLLERERMGAATVDHFMELTKSHFFSPATREPAFSGAS